jgi:hypothetical protein
MYDARTGINWVIPLLCALSSGNLRLLQTRYQDNSGNEDYDAAVVATTADDKNDKDNDNDDDNHKDDSNDNEDKDGAAAAKGSFVGGGSASGGNCGGVSGGSFGG